MSRRSRLQIGSLYFSSRSAAEEFYKKIKDSYESQAGEPIAEESDVNALRALVLFNPHTSKKIGRTDNGYFTVNNDSFGSFCFWFVRDDGTRDSFSYRNALNINLSDEDYYKKQAIEALRSAIVPQIHDFLDVAFSRGTVYCPFYPHMEIKKYLNNVHHEDPGFKKLVDDWLLESGLNYENIETRKPENAAAGITQMANPEQRRSWYLFHLKHARLLLLSPEGHQSIHGRR